MPELTVGWVKQVFLFVCKYKKRRSYNILVEIFQPEINCKTDFKLSNPNVD